MVVGIDFFKKPIPTAIIPVDAAIMDMMIVILIALIIRETVHVPSTKGLMDSVMPNIPKASTLQDTIAMSVKRKTTINFEHNILSLLIG